MSKLWLSFLTILVSLNVYCQTKITGTVKSSLDESPMYDAKVSLRGNGETVQSDRIGYFQFIKIPDGNYVLEIEKEGFEPYQQEIAVKGEKLIELNDLFLTYAPDLMERGIVTLTVDELGSDEGSSQPSVGLLQSSKDVFARSAAYELGSYWFRTRGYDNKYSDVYFNGIRMNKIDDGRVDFGNWGGLNDITRYPAEVTYGIEPSDYAFGDLGGVTYVDTRPSVLRTGTSLSYSLTNRSYRQRVMLTHNTGLNAKGWGFTVSGSRRWANEGRIEGTFYDAWGYYLGIEKRVNNKHSFLFSAFGAPNRRGTNSPDTQEVYDIIGSTNYNSYWGYQGDKKRSERVKKTFEPVFSLTHYWNMSDKAKLTTTLGYQTGENSRSRLNYVRGIDNPSPTYYRYMPSIEETLGEGLVAAREWRKDNGKHQINWYNLYKKNILGDGRANYFLVSDVNQDNTLTFNTNYRNQVSDAFNIYANLSYQRTNSNLFRRAEDLLGAEYILDKDGYAGKGQSGDYNTDNPDRKAYVGDKIEYNYNINHDKVDGYLAGNYNAGNLDLTLGAKVSNTRIQRDGVFNNYRYDNSKGKSKEYSFLDYGAKLNATYKINGRNYLILNGAYYTNAPTVNELFPQQRVNSASLPRLESAKILSGDLNYVLRAPRVKARATAFYSSVKDEVQTTFAYFERDIDANYGSGIFGAEVLKGVDKEYLGSEIAVEAQVTSTLTLNGVASIGQYIYKNNPDLYYFADLYSDQEGYGYQGKAYLKNYHLASSPQKAVSVGFQYRSPDYWWIGATGNYLADNYVNIAASRRTEGFFKGVDYTDEVKENARKLLTQEEFDAVFMLNANAGKSFKFGKYYMGISLSVNNLLDNKKYKTGGFEQGRLANYDALNNPKRRETFGNKYWYDQGTSYYLNVYFRF